MESLCFFKFKHFASVSAPLIKYQCLFFFVVVVLKLPDKTMKKFFFLLSDLPKSSSTLWNLKYTSFLFISNDTPHPNPLLLQINCILFCVSLPPQPPSLSFFYSVLIFLLTFDAAKLCDNFYQLFGHLFLLS